jgi:enediyne biosynthesis protein E4
MMIRGVPGTLLCFALLGAAQPHVRYADITAASGVSSFTHVSGSAAKDYIIEATGSGVALWDFDNDGLLDIYLVNGGTLDALRRGAPQPRAALFRNTGRGTFRDVTAEAGVVNERWGQGVCAGDFDNDGDQDLYVTNFGRNRLYRSASGRTFEDIAVKAGVAVDSWSTGCAFGDYDGDGWLDLYVAGYVALDVKNLPPAPATKGATSTGTATPAAGAGAPTSAGAGTTGLGAAFSAGATVCRYRGEPVMCGPSGLPGAPDQLFRNNRDGTFTDVTRAAGVEDAKLLYGFGVAWVDMDDDGKLDLIVANDSGPNHVYRNLGNGTFEDVSYASGAALDANGRAQAHMGVAVGDYDNDGRADLHITNFADDYNVLYRNLGGFTFTDASFSAGLAQVTMPFLGWGTNFLDADNDGWQDLLVVNGHVYPAADRLSWNTSYTQRALLFRNLGASARTSDVPASATGKSSTDLSKAAKTLSKEATFEEIGASAGDALSTRRASRGSATGDLDNDGAVDIVINNLDGPPTVARNESGAKSGHWLQVRLIGDPARKCPKDAIGSVVFVTAGGVRQRGEVASGRGQISQSDLRLHFGLGPDAKAAAVSELQVRWANGPAVTYRIDRIDTVAVIDQTAGTVTFPAPRQ